MRVQRVHHALEFALNDIVKVGAGAFDGRVDQRLLRLRRFLQHVGHDLRRRAWMTDADAQARVVGNAPVSRSRPTNRYAHRRRHRP